MKETVFYDAAGNKVDAQHAVRAEITTRSEEGTVLSVEYYDLAKPEKASPSHAV